MRLTVCPECRTRLDGVSGFARPEGSLLYELNDGARHRCKVRHDFPDGWCAAHGSWSCGLLDGACRLPR